jgi:hypothetical protein
MDTYNSGKYKGEIYTHFDETCSIPCDTIINDISRYKDNLFNELYQNITTPFIEIYRIILNEFGITE